MIAIKNKADSKAKNENSNSCLDFKNDKYVSPEEMYEWLNQLKQQIKTKHFLFCIFVYKSECCEISTIDGYARFVIFAKRMVEPVNIVDFKADDSKKNDKNLTSFEDHFAKFFEIIKNMPVILDIKCNFRPESPLWHLQDFQTVKKVHDSFPEARFYWTGRQLIGIVKTNSELFKRDLDKVLEFKNILLDVNDDSFQENDSYNQMKENLLYWMDHMHIGLNVSLEVAPLLSLILILLPGLAGTKETSNNSNQNIFHEFLTRGLYDPRLLLLIEEFMRPTISQIIYPFYGIRGLEYLAHSYFPNNWL